MSLEVGRGNALVRARRERMAGSWKRRMVTTRWLSVEVDQGESSKVETQRDVCVLLMPGREARMRLERQSVRGTDRRHHRQIGTPLPKRANSGEYRHVKELGNDPAVSRRIHNNTPILQQNHFSHLRTCTPTELHRCRSRIASLVRHMRLCLRILPKHTKAKSPIKASISQAPTSATSYNEGYPSIQTDRYA